MHFSLFATCARYQQTLVTDFIEKRLELDGDEVTFHLWDTPGWETRSQQSQQICLKGCLRFLLGTFGHLSLQGQVELRSYGHSLKKSICK